MKIKTQFLLLLISVSLFSCNSTVKNPIVPISNLDTDFAITEQLDFKFFNKYDIFGGMYCKIDDSILWIAKEEKSDFGSCYNLHTGEKLATIASRGKAANELIQLDCFEITGDSVLLYAGHTIKAFAKKDIINNIPMGDRKFSITTAPDSILVFRMAKLPNGSVLATIEPASDSAKLRFQEGKINEFNQKSVALFNNKEANSYETINYESFDIEKVENNELSAKDLVKSSYSNGIIAVKDNNMAVFTVANQFILYTFDIKSGNVVNEKRYTEMKRGDSEEDNNFVSCETVNDKSMQIQEMQVCDETILCRVSYLVDDGINKRLNKDAIFVFDWKLNPIKKFDLPSREKGYYIISNDCKSVYCCENNEDGFTLYKADLNI